MKKRIASIAFAVTIGFGLLAAALSSSACTGKEAKTAPVVEAPAPVIAWPPAPKPARIVFSKTARAPHDWGFKKSVPKKILDIVLGKPFGTEFESPYAVASAADGRTVITDTARGAVYLLNPVKGKYKIIHKAGKERLLSPVGVAFDGVGTLYVADSTLAKIFMYDAKGKFAGRFAADVAFKRPTCMALDAEAGTMYVVDTEASEVVALGLDGAMKRKITSYDGGPFNRPSHIAVAKDGEVVVNDSLNFRIALFDREGKFVKAFGHNGDGTGNFARPRGVAVDSEGHIYVADAIFDVVQIFDRDGNFLLSFGGTGGEAGQMYMPAGVFIGADDRIMVADQGNRRIQFYQYVKEQREATR